MKLVSFEHRGSCHYGAVKGDKVVDLGARLGGLYQTIVDFIAGDGLPIARSIVESEPGDFDYDDLKLLPVVPIPAALSALVSIIMTTSAKRTGSLTARIRASSGR